MGPDEAIHLIKDALLEFEPTRRGEFERITSDQEIDALGFDSVSTMDLLALIEERSGVMLPDEALRQIERVGDLVTILAGEARR